MDDKLLIDTLLSMSATAISGRGWGVSSNRVDGFDANLLLEMDEE